MTKIKEIGADTFVGEIAFFTGNARTASAKARGITEVLCLDQSSFNEICEQNEEAKQT